MPLEFSTGVAVITFMSDEEMAVVVERLFREFVLTEAALAVYNPHSTRRPSVPVRSFEVELLEIDDSLLAHAAGVVVLQTSDGPLTQFLRLSAQLVNNGQGIAFENPSNVRAAYIVEMDPETGACKETAAYANAGAQRENSDRTG